MIRPARLLLLIVPLAIGFALHSPGGAQTAPPGGRFAFADTTLLRDTLGLHFDGLFPLADSLGVAPDTLRALAIRYQMTLLRMTYLADSMRVPVDSVGPIMWRERYNPLSNQIAQANALTYTSSYNTAQTSSTWNNNTDWSFIRGPWYATNNTTITLDRFTAGGELSVREQRAAVTEGGWKYSRNLSVGGRADLERFDSDEEKEVKNEFQFSSRALTKSSPHFSNDFSVFAGVLSLTNTREVKRGLSGDFNTESRFESGGWLVHDVKAHVGGNASRTRPPERINTVSTHDVANSVDGTLSVFQSAPIAFNLAYGVRRNRTQTPIDTVIQTIQLDNDRATGTLRLKRTSDRYLTLTGVASRSSNVTASSLSSLNTNNTQDLNAAGRWDMLGSFLDASFDNTFSNSRFPHRTALGGYGIRGNDRSVHATVTTNFGRRVTLKLDGLVSLGQNRYYTIHDTSSTPANSDDYRQSYRVEAQYNRSAKMSTRVAVEVIQSSLINLASVTANNRIHTYRAEWNWNYLLMPGLTVTQRDQISADYTYAALATSNQLSLSYDELTTLNAVLSPRTSIEITHNGKSNPSGSFATLPDGLVFSKGDESRDYTLRTRVSFQPATVMVLDMTADYVASGRSTATDAGNVPQRRTRTLNMSGGGTFNVPVGGKGALTGNLRRMYNSAGSVQFQSGVAIPSPSSHLNYWTGSLALTWKP